MNASRNRPLLDRAAVQSTVEQIGRRIAGRRVELGMSQEECATRAETSQGRVSAIETATGAARIDTIARVAQVVGFDVALVDRADKMESPASSE